MYTGFTKDVIWMNTEVCSVTIKSGLHKFISTRQIFWARNFICSPDCARKKNKKQKQNQTKKKTGAQNQTQCVNLIEKQLETIIFVLRYLNRALEAFIFNVISSKVFVMRLL